MAKRGKLTGKAKAAFLARMNRGRAKAGIAPVGKPSHARSAKAPSSHRAASSRRPKTPQKVTVTRARAGKPRPGGRGGGKHVPVKLDIQISEKSAPRAPAAARAAKAATAAAVTAGAAIPCTRTR